jgi:hypothetical protein
MIAASKSHWENTLPDCTPGSVRSRTARRAYISEVVRSRAGLLPSEDATLIKAVYLAGQPISTIARLCGRPRHRIAARVDSLVRRIQRPEFVFVAGAMHRWTDVRRRVGVACILHGMSINRAAAHLNMSRYAVRRHREAILALSQGSRP